MFLAKIYIKLKPTVNDPQGKTILGAMNSLGYSEPTDVRAGKYIEVLVNCPKRGDALTLVEEICNKLLVNPVIETYNFDLQET